MHNGLGSKMPCFFKDVAKNGLALWSASQALRHDKDVVLKAVAQNGRALLYASEELQADPDIILAADQ